MPQFPRERFYKDNAGILSIHCKILQTSAKVVTKKTTKLSPECSRRYSNSGPDYGTGDNSLKKTLNMNKDLAEQD